MTIKGETVSTGATLEPCEFCGETPELGIYRSAAGHYIGYACCMPYSRESGYYPSREVAENDLDSYKPRDTEFNADGNLEGVVAEFTENNES